MKKLLLATAFLLPLSAWGADLTLPTKAPQPLAFPWGKSGCYFGIAIKGGVDQTSSSGSALLATSLLTSGLDAAGAGVGGDVGCLKTYAPNSILQWASIEVSAYYQNIAASADATNGVSSVPVSYASRWSTDQTIKLGGLNLLSWLPNIGITWPTLPPPPTVTGINLIQPGNMYISVGVEEFGVSGNFFTAGGTTVGVAPLVGTGILNQISDTTGKAVGAVLDVGADVVFADRGLSVSNAFGTNGAPVFGTLSVGRKYEVYAKIQF